MWVIFSGLAIAAALAGCSQDNAPDAADAPRIDVGRATENVVIVVIDTLRADYVGAYGQTLDTTPFIDSLAEEGIVFENARSNSSFTRQSMSAMYSGLYPSHRGQIGHWAKPPPDRTVLPQYFAKTGYKTGYVSNQFVMADFVDYFDVGQSTPIGGGQPIWTSGEVSERALSIAKQFGRDRYFLYVHYIDPHALYEPTDEYYRRFQPNPIPRHEWVNSQFWTIDRDKYVAEGVVPGNPAWEDLKLRYAAEIAMTDDSVRKLIEGLRTQGQLEDTTVIILSDHGEEFFEHGYTGHSWTLFEESIRVPLILWSPGVEHPARITEPVSLVDVLPSLLDLFQIPYATTEFDGRSWFNWDGAELTVAPLPRPQVSELIYLEKTVQRATVDGKYKYYRSSLWWDPSDRWAIDSSQDARAKAVAMGETVPPSLWDLTQKRMIFDLESDPQESNNLYDRSQEIERRFESFRRAYRDRVKGAAVKLEHGSLTNELDSDAVERLKSLGYVH